MNVLDGRRFVGLLAREGFSEAASPEEAGVILLNTCSVRDKAEQKVYDRLGRLAKLKRERPDTVLGVCGCVAQQEGERLLERLPQVDFVLGTGRIESPSVGSAPRRGRGRPALRDRLRPGRGRLHAGRDRALGGVPRRDHGHRGLQQELHLLRRPPHARARAQSPAAATSWTSPAACSPREPWRSSSSGRP